MLSKDRTLCSNSAERFQAQKSYKLSAIPLWTELWKISTEPRVCTVIQLYPVVRSMAKLGIWPAQYLWAIICVFRCIYRYTCVYWHDQATPFVVSFPPARSPVAGNQRLSLKLSAKCGILLNIPNFGESKQIETPIYNSIARFGV